MDASKLITSFVIVIFGVIFVTLIATSISYVTKTTPDTEVVSIASARLGLGNGFNSTYRIYLNQSTLTTYTLSDPSVGCGGFDSDSFQFYNATGSTLSGNFTVTCPTGAQPYVTVSNNTYMITMLSNSTTWSYGYYAKGYQGGTFAGSTLNLIPGMLAILLLLGVIAGVYYYMRTFNSK
jgi:hypothetical protein